MTHSLTDSLTHSLTMSPIELSWTAKNVLDVLNRFVWKICWEWPAECLRALLTKSAIIVFTIMTTMMICMLVGVGGWAECGTGHPTHHSQKDWQQLLFGSNQSPAPYCPLTLPLSTCNLCFCIGIFVFYVRMCLHVFQIKPILSLAPNLLLFDGQR